MHDAQTNHHREWNTQHTQFHETTPYSHKIRGTETPDDQTYIQEPQRSDEAKQLGTNRRAKRDRRTMNEANRRLCTTIIIVLQQ